MKGVAMICFGPSRYTSPLTPDQLLSEMRQITAAKCWFRNPFASLEESFEGKVGGNGFDVAPLPHVRSNRPIAHIRANVLVGATGKTEIWLELLRPGVCVLAATVMGFMAVAVLAVSIAKWDFFWLVFAVFLFWQLSRQRLPNQSYAASSLALLQQRLQLTHIS